MSRPTSFEDLPLVMTVAEVADLLQVSKAIIYQLVRGEQLRKLQVGKQIRILRSDLQAYLTGGVPYPECDPGFAQVPLLLTVQDMMPLLKLDRNSVLELVHSEQIRCVRVSCQIRVLKYELQEFLLGGKESDRNDLV